MGSATDRAQSCLVNSSVLLDIAIAVLVVGWLLARQLQVKQVSADEPYRKMLILGVIGIVQIASFDKNHAIAASSWAVLGLSLVSALAFGLLRGSQVHVWVDEGVSLRQGNLITCVLWLVGIAIHISIDGAGQAIAGTPDGFGSATIVLYLAVTLGVQQLVIAERANRLQPTGYENRIAA